MTPLNKLLSVMQNQGGVTKPWLKTKTGFSERTVRRHLTHAIEQGKVITKGKNVDNFYLYKSVQTPEPEVVVGTVMKVSELIHTPNLGDKKLTITRYGKVIGYFIPVGEYKSE